MQFLIFLHGGLWVKKGESHFTWFWCLWLFSFICQYTRTGAA